ncbi:unnamed protein product [Soboliphyme baturini]|uniref:Zf-U1 domain-containing protein n=1 Tax=Soboliphyme baturini TaxID=241478 RepID=A0A183IH57_9BILA|nr:unnamed protein product [Soboliphyme baturini]
MCQVLRFVKFYLDLINPSVRKTHNNGRKHKENVRMFYQQWMEEQAQKLVDATGIALFHFYLRLFHDTTKTYLAFADLLHLGPPMMPPRPGLQVPGMPPMPYILPQGTFTFPVYKHHGIAVFV